MAVFEAMGDSHRYLPRALLDATGMELHAILEGILPSLVMMVAILALTTAIGAAAGAALGALAFGVGAVPGAAAGAGVGLEVGTVLLEWLGLAFLVVYIGKSLLKGTKMAASTVALAWHSADQSQALRDASRITAARELANAVAEVFRGVLQGIVAFLLAKGVAAAGSRVPELVANLRKSKLGASFATWVEKNWAALVENPKLKDASQPNPVAKPPTKAETPSNAAKAREGSGNDATNNSKKLEPGTPAHKSDRWEKYQDRGGEKSYEAWSKQYDTNMNNYKSGLARESDYRSAMDATEGTLKTPLTSRQIDILKADEMYAGQLKTGSVSLTQENILAIQKDAELVKQGWQVEHILEQGASGPYLKALEQGGIGYHIGPTIP